MPFVEKTVPTGRGTVKTEIVYEPPKLYSWAELVEECQVPPEVAAAVGTSRPELLELARRDMKADEVGMLVNLVRVLLQTNFALQQHCARLAEKTKTVLDNFKGVHRSLTALHLEAEMKNPESADPEDD